jgi:hypothetical protein
LENLTIESGEILEFVLFLLSPKLWKYFEVVNFRR